MIYGFKSVSTRLNQFYFFPQEFSDLSYLLIIKTVNYLNLFHLKKVVKIMERR